MRLHRAMRPEAIKRRRALSDIAASRVAEQLWPGSPALQAATLFFVKFQTISPDLDDEGRVMSMATEATRARLKGKVAEAALHSGIMHAINALRFAYATTPLNSVHYWRV